MATHSPPLLCTACICCYQGFDFDNIVICCKGSNECLCFEQDACCALGEDSLGAGMVTNQDNKECCAIGLFCIRCALKRPQVLCAGTTQALCCVQAQSFPFDERYVGQAVCAAYCLSCAPECGCGKPAPYSSKIVSLTKPPGSTAIKR